jgi:hypothetical protein
MLAAKRRRDVFPGFDRKSYLVREMSRSGFVSTSSRQIVHGDAPGEK